METSQEKIRKQTGALTSRMDVLEEMLDKTDAAVMVCLRKTEARIRTRQEPREADIKTGLV
jgi:hypothetical protein